MNKTAIKNYAIWARVNLIEAAKQKAFEYEITENGEMKTGIDSVGGRLLSKAEKEQRNTLIAQIRQKGFNQVMEEVAYTWFNRFIALRFMEVNGYLPSKVRIFTDENGAFKPEILKEATRVELDGIDRDTVIHLLDKQDNEGLYKYLLITQCNALNAALPGMFEKIANYTELLFPNNLLKQDSVIGRMISDIPEEDWTDAVQIIGWLYQYYNSELKDETFALLKKNVKITKERIPAATQLFTPDWIVRYMVENSLGRLWYEGHKNDELKSTWKYYLDEAEQEPEVEEQLKKIRAEYAQIKPEDIKVIDPCMGSGHILVYAFDVLMQIYTSAGWSERDAAKSILENNLYGLDIDDRAGQLAYFAVMMKARKYNRRVLTMGITPNVMSIQDSGFMTDDLIEYVANRNSDIRADLRLLRKDLKDAKELGSIINVTKLDYPALYTRIAEIEQDFPEDLMTMAHRTDALEKLLPLIKQAQVMSQKYDVVVTNPPYMGSNGMNSTLDSFVKKEYPDSKSDLFAAFMEKADSFVRSKGFTSLITMESWMFLSSFEALRRKINTAKTIINMVHMPYLGKGGTSLGINFGTAAVIMRNAPSGDYNAQYEYTVYYETDENGVPYTFPTKNNRWGVAKQTDFNKIPGGPIAYWASNQVINVFSHGKNINDLAYPRQGLATGNNDHYLRLWFETKYSEIKRDSASHEEFFSSGAKYVPYNKGGAFRKWYANIEWVIRFDKPNYDVLQTVGNHLPSKEFYFRESITWSKVTSGGLSMRYIPNGSVFDVAGCSIFADHDLKYILSFVNTKVMQHLMNILSQTLNYEVGSVKSIPLIVANDAKHMIEDIAQENLEVSKKDLDSFETSWDFKKHPLI